MKFRRRFDGATRIGLGPDIVLHRRELQHPRKADFIIYG
jgi:hypothetical protein